MKKHKIIQMNFIRFVGNEARGLSIISGPKTIIFQGCVDYFGPKIPTAETLFFDYCDQNFNFYTMSVPI